MKRYLFNSVLLTTVFALGVIYGIVTYKDTIGPHGIIKMVYFNLIKQIDPYGPWSIGVYEGLTPFELVTPKNVSNPILTGKDVIDVDASFVADPFMLFRDGKYTMFFEVLNRETNQGDIGYAVSEDGQDWEYRNIVIDEPFHLSYPYVFEWENDYYLIPESNQDFSVRLYKAVSYPEKWEYVGNLLTGYRYVDPSLFRHGDKWWLFVTTPQNDLLNLYYSSDLLGEWKPHPMNPIVKNDKNIARPGGRVITHNNRVYRMTQDDYPSYGMQVFAFEITRLTENSYAEKIVSEKPVVTMTGKGWNAAGMHHVDLHKIGERWVAVVDGRNR
jgi:hypothetical protein